MLAAARAVLIGVRKVAFRATGTELVELVGLVDDVVAAGVAARAGLVVEAVSRGEVAESSKASVTAWVRDAAPSLRQGGAAQVAALARMVAEATPVGEGVDGEGAAESPMDIVWTAVRAGECSVGLALDVLREVARLERFLWPAAVPTVTRSMLSLGIEWGAAHMRQLRPALLARYGVEGEFDKAQERLASHAFVSAPRVASGDLTDYRMGLTPEQTAVLETALGALSKPRPDPATGQRDPRSTGQRRAEALIEIVTAWLAQNGAQGAPGATGTALHVTVRLDELLARLGAGEVVGSAAAGTLLAPDVVRRLACEANVIPHVLGGADEPLALGRVVRLFTTAQRHALWLRDQHCTYPGCEIPALWCRVHHLTHWADGGGTDLDNAALLCERHHALVHSRSLVAAVRAEPDGEGRYVVWDLVPGSYDAALDGGRGRYCTGHRCRHAPHAPPAPLTLTELHDLVGAHLAGSGDHGGVTTAA